MNNQNNNQTQFFSIAFSYRLGLGFHALNNEGSDGSNLMQPRRIDVGKQTYDGISGEIIRHHILENFVNICRQESIAMLPLSEGLHPDRGPIGIRAAAKLDKETMLSNENLLKSVRRSIQDCAILDVGGFLAAYEKSEPKYIIEKTYLDQKCVPVGGDENRPQPIKRESCFDVAWLISEEPQDYTITQHSSFRDTANLNDRYSQVMRTNIYGGVIRIDLHRIGMDDNWYLQNDTIRLAITPEEQQRRQKALIKAVINFIASPTGAKVAAWAPHIFKVEGAILHSQHRTAPFISPISVSVNNNEKPVFLNENYQTEMSNITGDGITSWTFSNQQELLNGIKDILSLTSKSTETNKSE